MTPGRCCMLTSLWLVAMSAVAPAQEFPARPVKIITDSAPGSAIDVILRVIADRLGQIWGQQVSGAEHQPEHQRRRIHGRQVKRHDDRGDLEDRGVE